MWDKLSLAIRIMSGGWIRTFVIKVDYRVACTLNLENVYFYQKSCKEPKSSCNAINFPMRHIRVRPMEFLLRDHNHSAKLRNLTIMGRLWL